MSYSTAKYDEAGKKYDEEPEIAVATAIPTDGKDDGTTGEAPVPSGHARFYCSKCHTVGNFDLLG